MAGSMSGFMCVGSPVWYGQSVQTSGLPVTVLVIFAWAAPAISAPKRWHAPHRRAHRANLETPPESWLNFSIRRSHSDSWPSAEEMDDHAGPERLFRNLAHPALPKGRIERTVDGRVSFDLKRPRRGTTRLLFEPLAFIARMAALIPRPGSNQTRFFGIYGTASLLRRYVLPTPPEPTPERPVAPERPRRMLRADLLRRVFDTDDLACSCGGRFRLIAVLTQPDVVQIVAAAIIMSAQKPARGPPSRPARTALT